MNDQASSRRAIEDIHAYWHSQAQRIEWHQAYHALHDGAGTSSRWFAGGQTNLCHNAVDRHVPFRPDQPALVHVCAAMEHEQIISYGHLFVEVQRMAAILREMGVGRGDRVLIHMPTMPEAVIGMLAAVRLGGVHVVVPASSQADPFALRELVAHARPKVALCADAAYAEGGPIPLKETLDTALASCPHKVARVLVVDRGLVPLPLQHPRDVDYHNARRGVMDAIVPCEWLDAAHPSCITYADAHDRTEGPVGMQRDTGGYAVAVLALMSEVFDLRAGDGVFCASDLASVSGHAAGVYGPLLAGMSTLLYEEGTQGITPAVCGSLMDRHDTCAMLAPEAAVAAWRHEDAAGLRVMQWPALKHVILMHDAHGEPPPSWIAAALGRPVSRFYWPAEAGGPVLARTCLAAGPGSWTPGPQAVPMPGYNLRLLDAARGDDIAQLGQPGVLALQGPLPPGCIQALWNDPDGLAQPHGRDVHGQDVFRLRAFAARDPHGHFELVPRTA